MDKDKILEYNRKAREMFRCTDERTLKGRSLFEFSVLKQLESNVPEERAKEHINAALTGFSRTFEWRFIRPDDSPFYSEVSLTPYKIRKKIFLQAIVRDITERKRTEQSLQIANKKLGLLTDITRHDIMNKMTVLTGYLDLISCYPHEPTFSSHMKKIYGTISTIISQIEFTRIYKNLGTADPVWQNIDLAFQNACSHIDTGTILITSHAKEWEIYADPLFGRVLYNLVDNAMKYGMTLTGIRLSVTETPDGLMVIFEDDGVGIPCQEKERIFLKGMGKNTGLGLFLAREILSITGISIRETGQEGTGARFEMTIPAGAYRLVTGSKGIPESMVSEQVQSPP